MKNLPLIAASVPLLFCLCAKMSDDTRRARSGEAGERALPDVSVFVSAVVVPDTYDWHRDTACGASACTLILVRDGETVLAIPTGSAAEVGTDPDTHHLIGGHLYTEYSSPSETVIRRDGAELFRYEGREVLLGLLEDGESIYTLGRNRSGEGFCLRRDGEVLLRQNSGTVFGSFSHSSYGRTGALYRDGGAVCFCYRNGSSCFIVKDGSPSPVNLGISASRVGDMHVFGSEAYAIADMMLTTTVHTPSGNRSISRAGLTDLGLFQHGGQMKWAGSEPSEGGSTFCGVVDGNVEKAFSGNGNFLYPAEGTLYTVGTGSGMLLVQKEDHGVIFGRDSTYLFSRDCATVFGKDLYVLVNPRERDETPFLWKNGEEVFFCLNGFLTAVEVVVNPSS